MQAGTIPLCAVGNTVDVGRCCASPQLVFHYGLPSDGDDADGCCASPQLVCHHGLPSDGDDADGCCASPQLV